MKLTSRIRKIIDQNRRTLAQRILVESSFWYHEGMRETSQVYWSENHYIMNTSCELLLREFLGMPIPDALLIRIRTFLKIKIRFGFAEFLSPVYLPFSIASLLNLYDYSKYCDIRESCEMLLNRLAICVLSITSLDGGIISPSGRSYARHRIKTTGLHLNQFTDFLRRGQPAPYDPTLPEMALRETLATTYYRPSSSAYTYFTDEPLDIRMSLTPTYDELLGCLEQEGDAVSTDIFASMLWSHGIYIPKDMTSMTRIVDFMDTFGLWYHPHFQALRKVRSLFACDRRGTCFTRTAWCLSHSYIVQSFVHGAYLTNVIMYVHREGNLVMSSLEGYNEGLPCFQQWPFAINANGVPIYSTYGTTTQSVISCLGNQEANKEMSTARVMPRIRHVRNRVKITYKASNAILQLANANIQASVYMPLEELDEHGTHTDNHKHVWVYGRKGSVVVAYFIRGRSSVYFVVRDLQTFHLTMSLSQFLESCALTDDESWFAYSHEDTQ